MAKKINKNDYFNDVYVEGVVSKNQPLPNGTGFITITCPTIVLQKTDSGYEYIVRTNYPNFHYNKTLCNKYEIDNIYPGTSVRIKGRIGQFFNINERKMIPTLTLDKIEKLNGKLTEIYNLEPNRRFARPDFKNEFYVRGTINEYSAYYTDPNTGLSKVSMLVKIRSSREVTSIRITLFNVSESSLKKFTKGSKIYAVGTVNTGVSKVNEDGRSNIYQTFAVQDYVVLNENGTEKKAEPIVKVIDEE